MIMNIDDLIQRIYKVASDIGAVLTPVTEKTLESHLKRFEYGDDKHRRAAKAIRLRYYDGKIPKEIGQWVLVGTNEHDYETSVEEKCSLCGRYVYRYDTEPQDNYCPNCGAKMESEGST